jgi:armadillo repeat-containing protein 6
LLTSTYPNTFAKTSILLIPLIFFTEFKDNSETICELLLTIAALCVRHELCLVVEENGGLKFIMDAMVEFSDSQRLIREALKLLKALAGHDSVKLQIIQSGAAPLIESALNRFKANEIFAKVALGCVSTLSLRVKENSIAFFEAGITETIVQTMKIHETSKVVQRNGAWSIRNMVSRNRDQCETFINFVSEWKKNQHFYIKYFF